MVISVYFTKRAQLLGWQCSASFGRNEAKMIIIDGMVGRYTHEHFAVKQRDLL